jgi:hypothetical protein
MAKVMFTLELDPEEATVEHVRKRLGLEGDALDQDYGVVCIDPERSLYTILVEEGAVPELEGAEGIEGPYSNPPIEPFGPPS